MSVAFRGILFFVFVLGIFEFFGVVDDGQILGRYVGRGPSGSFGLFFAGTMLVLHLVGWVWGRSLYR
ncbi:MAG: hypothetical protein WAN34_13600 [Acidimicrobiia bacterium]